MGVEASCSFGVFQRLYGLLNFVMCRDAKDHAQGVYNAFLLRSFWDLKMDFSRRCCALQKSTEEIQSMLTLCSTRVSRLNISIPYREDRVR